MEGGVDVAFVEFGLHIVFSGEFGCVNGTHRGLERVERPLNGCFVKKC